MTKPPIARVDLVSLRLLVAAIDEGNLAAVAARENIALSGVSRRISDLEQRWGVTLLHRHDRGVRPTPALETIAGRLRGLLALLDQIADDVAAIGSGTRGLVRIGANMTALGSDLGHQVAAFAAAHPGIDVQLEEMTTVDILHGLRIGSHDVGLISGTVDADDFDLHVWQSDELVALLPLNHALAGQASVTFAQLLGHPFVSMQRDSALHALFRSHSHILGRTMDERAHVSSFATVVRLVEVGLGVSILPRVAVDRVGSAVAVLPLAEPWARRELMVCTPRSYPSPTARKLVHLLLDRPTG